MVGIPSLHTHTSSTSSPSKTTFLCCAGEVSIHTIPINTNVVRTVCGVGDMAMSEVIIINTIHLITVVERTHLH
jgi:hypothetical protein